jgi:hypothetical protein
MSQQLNQLLTNGKWWCYDTIWNVVMVMGFFSFLFSSFFYFFSSMLSCLISHLDFLFLICLTILFFTSSFLMGMSFFRCIILCLFSGWRMVFLFLASVCLWLPYHVLFLILSLLYISTSCFCLIFLSQHSDDAIQRGTRRLACSHASQVQPCMHPVTMLLTFSYWS